MSKRFGKIRRVTCALIGHSRIIDTDFGYVHCARCDARIGDTLAGAYDMDGRFIVGHNCEKCRTNYRAMTWRDKLFVRNPLDGRTNNGT